ncbi:Diacylglycerol kinase [Geobacillus sp. BCO2]|nr:Diacylglycerol kinase [Geobacillus sp. BCO2]
MPDVLVRLEKVGYETSCHATEGPGDATKAARQAVLREFDLVVAAGATERSMKSSTASPISCIGRNWA